MLRFLCGGSFVLLLVSFHFGCLSSVLRIHTPNLFRAREKGNQSHRLRPLARSATCPFPQSRRITGRVRRGQRIIIASRRQTKQLSDKVPTNAQRSQPHK
ncbi:hypothetical protein F4678DRAFT_418642 [Xylaria arbuscula]|nr:hypothetical protein F4678DRAFT_418642 [Xylaria arbuscula]